MPTFEVTSPDGRTFEVTAPEGTTQAQALDYARKQFGGGGGNTNSGVTAPQQPAQPSITDAVPPARQFLQAAFPMLGGAYLPDLAMGIRQPLDAAAQALARLAPSSLGGGAGNTAETVNKAALEDYKQRFGEIPGSDVARGAGQALVTAPIAPIKAVQFGPGFLKGLAQTGTAAAQAAGTGALASAATPIYDEKTDFWKAKGEQAAQGAALGGAFGGILGGVGRALGPTKEAAAMMKEGITPTLGQTLGGVLKRTEERASSYPIVGDLIRSGQGSSLDDFNIAFYNRILKPIGERYKGPVGQEGVTAVGDRLSGAYKELLPQMGPTVIDSPFLSAGQNLQSMLRSTPEAAERFRAAYQHEVLNKITPGGTLLPEAMKRVESRLGEIARGFKASSDSDQRLAGQALDQLVYDFRGMVARSNPSLAPRLQAINDGWAQLAQLERAAGTVKAAGQEGRITPADLLRGIKAGDTSVRDRMFARGQMLNQDFAQAADKVLSSKYPDSGTAGRLMQGLLAGGAAGAGAAGLLSPSTIALTALAGIPYVPGGRQTVAALSRGAGSLPAIAPYLGLLAPGLYGAAQ